MAGGEKKEWGGQDRQGKQGRVAGGNQKRRARVGGDRMDSKQTKKEEGKGERGTANGNGM